MSLGAGLPVMPKKKPGCGFIVDANARQVVQTLTVAPTPVTNLGSIRFDQVPGLGNQPA